MGKARPEVKRRERAAVAGIAEQLAALDKMAAGELAEKYREVFGVLARSRNKQYLRKRVAWRIQELAEGGLSERALQRIEELAPLAPVRWRQPAARNVEAAPGDVAAIPIKVPDSRLPPVGTVLTRLHKRVEHKVTILDGGFEYNGERYRSLSKVARIIAGTPWNGFFFFGLASRAGKKIGEPRE